MSKLKQAVILSHNEWQKKLDEDYKKALLNGEIPQKTKEEIKADAQRIWELAHKDENKI